MTTNTNPQPTAAWLINEDGTAEPLAAAERNFWPGSARVTLMDGTTRVVYRAAVRAADNLNEPFKF